MSGSSVHTFKVRVEQAVEQRREKFKVLALEALKRAREEDAPLTFPTHCHTETTLFDAFRAMRAEIRAHEVHQMAIEMEKAGLSDHDIFLLLGHEK